MSLEILNNPLIGNSFDKIMGGNSPNPIQETPALKTPVELKQKTVKQIANTYYNGKPVAESKGFQIYSDEPIFTKDIEEVTIYRNRFAETIGGIDVVLFASKNGAFLLQRYMEALPQSNELILFLEIDDNYNYNTVLRAVAGANLTNKKDIPFADLLTFTRKHEVTIKPDKLKELIEDGIYRNKVDLISWFLGLKDAAVAKVFNFFTKQIFQEAEKFFAGIATGIEGLKISEKGWNPNPKEGEYNPTFIPEVLYNELKKFYEHESSKNPYENLNGQKQVISKVVKALFEKIDAVKTYFKNLLRAASPLFPDYIYNRVEKALNLFFKQIDSIEDYLTDPLTGMQHIIYKSFQIANAFLSGIYNSIIDIIAGIFSLIGFVFKAVYEMRNISDNKVEYGEMFLELIEDVIEGIMNFDYKDFLYQSITFQLRTIIRLVKWIENAAAGFSLEKAAYYYGYIIGIIIDIIIETLLTGGTAALAKLAKSVESFILKPLEKISQAIEKTVTFTKDLITRVLDFIQMILREFKKGVKELFTKLSKFLDEVFGLSEDVVSTPKTRAEERWRDRQQRIQKKIENKKKKKLQKKIDKKYSEFISKWENLSLLTLTKSEIIDILTGFTKHSDEVAELLRTNKMQYEFLDDVDFEDLLRDYDFDNELTDEIIMGTRAATLDGKTFYRSSASVDQFLTEIIHEGSHVIDNLLKKELKKQGKTQKEINKIIGNNWDQEIKAFSHERDWQLKIGVSPEYESLKEIETHVQAKYPKY
ncbi:MAG: hypothetical protein DI622_15515 [Chryseobacterium sp.]|uniref:hypothetical protein n=1 Tax=Chryseobacterium sp. TaxID=1871047 RepID=UPI000DB42B0A|nr:hypothetical protein [Chryseobacterium sp.]MPS64074.1 hypothetical protein [Chryseobacterium sp.]PZU12123.1 MAG: hypothetical protein DI622_15515 [Chryseobacterium sp.]